MVSMRHSVGEDQHIWEVLLDFLTALILLGLNLDGYIKAAVLMRTKWMITFSKHYLCGRKNDELEFVGIHTYCKRLT